MVRIKPALPKIKSAIRTIKEPWKDIQEALPTIKTAYPGMEMEGGGYFNLVRYYGGRYKQLGSTLPFIEMVASENNAHTYIECFGGGGKCVLNLDTLDHRFDRAIYNEWDKGMCRLFEVVANQETCKQLAEKLKLLDYSMEAFNYCKLHRLDKENSLLDIAFMTFVLCQLSYNASMDSFRHDNNQSEYEQAYLNSVERLNYAAEHLQGVEVINGDYEDLMKIYGSDAQVLKYLDPPFHPVTRGIGATNVYQNELSREQHQEMVELLCNSRSWVMSGYDPAQYGCSDYVPLEECGAVKVSIGGFMLASSKDKISKEEFIWYKF